jgi:imidazolonepropionase-like amidohydrolase
VNGVIRSGLVLASSFALATGCVDPGPRGFESVNARRVVFTHIRVIDGSGAPAREDQTVVVRDGRIQSVGPSSDVERPADAAVVDGRGRTLFPGLVGMHEHLFYQLGDRAYPVQAAFARLYLASGVTTIRTAGTVDFAGDLRIRDQIDAGRLPGPEIHVTGPYLNAGSGLPDPERITREVGAQAARGATSIKAYGSLRRSELRAAIDAAHAAGLTVTGHPCAVGFRDAAEMGIDNLEHGLPVDSDFHVGKQADQCPEQGPLLGQIARIDVRTDVRVQQLLADLLRHNVSLTSTLAVFETFTGDTSALDPRTRAVLAPRLLGPYDAGHARWSRRDEWTRAWAGALSREMQFERMFVAAGGRLMAGVDPTGWGGVVAGFGDHRQLELLVEAGFTPEMAIRISSANGAAFLDMGDEIGRIAPGYRADLVVVHGNPSKDISDVRRVEAVFKKGIGYDSAALIAATEGTVGRYDVRQIFRWPFNMLFIVLVSVLGVRVTLRRRRQRAYRTTPVVTESVSAVSE